MCGNKGVSDFGVGGLGYRMRVLGSEIKGRTPRITIRMSVKIERVGDLELMLQSAAVGGSVVGVVGPL